jgi:hypothetical protein
MKELEIKLAHWERESKNYDLQMYLKKTVMISLSRKEDHRNVNKQKQDKKS